MSAAVLVYRVQHDDDGRGPYRPGFSASWVDDSDQIDSVAENVFHLLSPRLLQEMRVSGLHIGCGCRTLSTLLSWFTPTERVRLALHHYSIVRLAVDVVYAESARQVVFGRRRSLTEGATRYRWPQ